MKNKAFTLVELLGVIVILGLLSIVIIPKVGDSIKNSKETSYRTQVNTIKKAANDFLIENTSTLETNKSITIKLGILKQEGYLPLNIKNPKTRKDFSNESLITITRNEEKYNFNLSLIDLENVTQDINYNSPILILNGDYIQYVEVYSEYEELGATAMTSDGSDLTVPNPTIKKGDNTVANISTTKPQTYNVIYEATDNGITTSATRTVIVRDSTPPVITIPSSTTIQRSELQDFNLMTNVQATDNYDKNVSVRTNSSVSDIPGKYVITYTATDSSGNQAVERRIIIVQ